MSDLSLFGSLPGTFNTCRCLPWEFTGLVAAHDDAARNLSAATAGVDVENQVHCFGKPLQQAVTEGNISHAVGNSRVAPILNQLFRFNFVNYPRRCTRYYFVCHLPPAALKVVVATTPA